MARTIPRASVYACGFVATSAPEANMSTALTGLNLTHKDPSTEPVLSAAEGLGMTQGRPR